MADSAIWRPTNSDSTFIVVHHIFFAEEKCPELGGKIYAREFCIVRGEKKIRDQCTKTFLVTFPFWPKFLIELPGLNLPHRNDSFMYPFVSLPPWIRIPTTCFPFSSVFSALALALSSLSHTICLFFSALPHSHPDVDSIASLDGSHGYCAGVSDQTVFQEITGGMTKRSQAT